MASLLEEHQEKLRRSVDEWRSKTHLLLANLHSDHPYLSPSTSPSPPPLRLHIEPIDHSPLPSLVRSDNAAVSKLLTVLSYSSVHISRLRKSSAKNLHSQLLVFAHRSTTQEVLLEGEPQEAFAESLPLFLELYETVGRMRELVGNLLGQLGALYSSRRSDGSGASRPFGSFRNVKLATAFASVGEGLAVLLVLDEILKENRNVRGYLSLFARRGFLLNTKEIS